MCLIPCVWLVAGGFQAGKTKGTFPGGAGCCGNCFPIPCEASIIFIKSQDLISGPDQDGALVEHRAHQGQSQGEAGEEGINSHHRLVLPDAAGGAPPAFGEAAHV